MRERLLVSVARGAARAAGVAAVSLFTLMALSEIGGAFRAVGPFGGATPPPVSQDGPSIVSADTAAARGRLEEYRDSSEPAYRALQSMELRLKEGDARGSPWAQELADFPTPQEYRAAVMKFLGSYWRYLRGMEEYRKSLQGDLEAAPPAISESATALQATARYYDRQWRWLREREKWLEQEEVSGAFRRLPQCASFASSSTTRSLPSEQARNVTDPDQCARDAAVVRQAGQFALDRVGLDAYHERVLRDLERSLESSAGLAAQPRPLPDFAGRVPLAVVTGLLAGLGLHIWQSRGSGYAATGVSHSQSQ